MPNTQQLSPRILANRRNGAKGGRKTAQSMTAEQKIARGQKGGLQTLARHGRDYYSCIGQARKTVGRPKLVKA